eukprot:3936658-Rhodomonas_salina.1
MMPKSAREEGLWYDLPISRGQWNMRDALKIAVSFPTTLADIRIQSAATTLTVALAEWAELRQPWVKSGAGLASDLDLSSPFVSEGMTQVWKAAVNSKQLKSKKDVEKLSLQDSLEPDLASRREAMQQQHFKDFWLDAEKTEWNGLWERC